MNSVFLNYDTSYFDLLNDRLPILGNERLLKSSNGKIVETSLDCSNSFGDPSITAAPGNLILSIGERNSENRSLNYVDIGNDFSGDYSEFDLNLYPPTTLYNGLKFEGGLRVNSVDLWVDGSSGSLKYRDRNVVSSGSAISGNLAVFGSSTVGAIEDSGFAVSSGVIVLGLEVNLSDPGVSVGIDFEYQKIGKCVNLILRKKLFQGGSLGSPNGFQTQNAAGLLPVFLRPREEISCPILIYQQVAGVRAELITQVGLLRLGSEVNGSPSFGNVEIYKQPDGNESFNADSGNFDGWSGTCVSYFTA